MPAREPKELFALVAKVLSDRMGERVRVGQARDPFLFNRDMFVMSFSSSAQAFFVCFHRPCFALKNPVSKHRHVGRIVSEDIGTQIHSTMFGKSLSAAQ